MMTNVRAERETLEVEGLRVELTSGAPVVEDVSLSVSAGTTLALVGESGSGKTTVALALLGFARRGMRIAAGEIVVGGQRMPLANERAARLLRGRYISHVPQDPSASLNPSLRIRDAIGDIVRAHMRNVPRPQVVSAALDKVHLPSTPEFQHRFPHQLSGGQQQRVVIANALVCTPPLIVLDEPTTGLDVVTQARILAEIKRLHVDEGIAMVYVSHDLAVVSQIADRVAVMYGGRVVEEGPVEEMLRAPRHPYTRGLLDAIPDHLVERRLHGIPGVAVGVSDKPAGCAFAPRCAQRIDRCTVETPPFFTVGPGHQARCFEWERTPQDDRAAATVGLSRSHTGRPLLVVEHLTAVHHGRAETIVAANDVSFTVDVGECVGLVGESGSGKTTIARCVAGLHVPASGRILLDGVPLERRARERAREARRRCQIVFQNPYDSLNPRRRVGDEIARAAVVLRNLSRRDARNETERLLELVRLPARLASRFPGELSGGERQRVAIARAAVTQPDLIICDEITSALDVSVQAAVIDLLIELRETFELALLFITHDLGVIRSVADRLLVLDGGLVCEEGRVDEVFAAPASARTRELLEAAPRLLATG